MRLPRLSEMLRQANQAMAASYAAHSPGITIPQAEILRALLKHGPLNQRRLTEETVIDRSTLSEALQRMKDNLLIVCVRDETDGRAVIVAITHAGRAAVVKADGADLEAERQMMGRLTRMERIPFRESLMALGTAAE